MIELADEKGLYCGKLLGDMGADVIKVERPGGDRARALPPFRDGIAGADRSLPFAFLNTSKRGITLDIETERGAELFVRLASSADLIVETLAPGSLDRLGLGRDELAASNPRLVITSITDFGATGPHAGYRGSDLVASALGRAMHVTGFDADPPVAAVGMQAYVSASVYAASASMIALFHATRSGHGQHVDISVEEVVASYSHVSGAGKYLSDGIVPKRYRTGLFASVPSGAYPCKDGLIYLMVNRPAHWESLARWINETTGNAEVLDSMFEGPSSVRQPYRDLLDIFIGELTATLTVTEAYHEGQRRHIAMTPVNTATAMVADEQLADREFFVDVAQADGAMLRYPGAPFRPSRTPWSMRRAPGAGEHNEEVLCGELGLERGEVDELAAAGVV